MNNYNVAQRINSQVNASVTYKTDLAQFEVPEFWQEAGVFNAIGNVVCNLFLPKTR